MRFITTILGLMLSTSALAGAPEQCNAWLSEHYKSHELKETIRDYERDGERHYRANYYVITALNEFTAIGFDCAVYPGGHVRAFPQSDPFDAEQRPTNSDLPQARMTYGADACPSMIQWREWMDDVEKTDGWVDLSGACIWIEEGQIVLGPVDEAEYRDAPFVLIQLPDGDRYWIEPSNL